MPRPPYNIWPSRLAASVERNRRIDAAKTPTSADLQRLGLLRRVRSFTTRSGTVVNRGDSYLVRGKTASGRIDADSSGQGSHSAAATSRHRPDDLITSTDESYVVLVLGSQGVGKTTVTQQLLTSEYLANKNYNVADEPGDALATVTVQIDDEESTVRFVESRDVSACGVKASLVDGYLVIYSVTDRSSFRYAQSCLQELRPSKRLNAVILVANKSDVVRHKVISTAESVQLATKHHCKFVEISALLDHKVDELLVGIVRQIRLRQTHDEPITADDEGRTGGRGGSRLATVLRDALRRLIDIATTPTRRQRHHDPASRPSLAECNDLFIP